MSGLSLTRKRNDKIYIDGGIEITVEKIKDDRVVLRILAPDHLGIWRNEHTEIDAITGIRRKKPLPVR